MSGPAESLYDVIVIGAGHIGQTVAGRARRRAQRRFPSISEVWLRLLEAYRH